MAFAPFTLPPQEKVVGAFKSKEKVFEFTETTDIKYPEYPHKVWISGENGGKYLWARIHKSVALVVEQTKRGKPIAAKWAIRNLINY